MGLAKNLEVKIISAASANKIIKSLHYSGKVVPNSQLHFGVFSRGTCGGAMQFGPSMRKDSIVGLVAGTGWNGFLELNRMAFADWLPRNGESRCIAFALRYIRRVYPHVEWVVSFADATQCGDGAIYRASGFVLTGIKKNTQLAIDPTTGVATHSITAHHRGQEYDFKRWQKLDGYQLRYIKFLNPDARSRLTVPILPFSDIEKSGAGMDRGIKRVRSIDSDAPAQQGEGGASPTLTLQDGGTT